MKNKKNYEYIIRYNKESKKNELFKQYKKHFLWRVYYKDVRVTDNSIAIKYKIIVSPSGHFWREEPLENNYIYLYGRHENIFHFLNHDLVDYFEPYKNYTSEERMDFLNKEHTESELLNFVEMVNKRKEKVIGDEPNNKYKTKKAIGEDYSIIQDNYIIGDETKNIPPIR